jgi:two-component system cell cycle sensor histidine kinase/response regulator CckA
VHPRSVPQLVSILAGLLAVAVVVLPISAYLLFSSRFAAGSVEVEAELGSQSVNVIVGANPEMWRFEHVRLVDILNRRPGDGSEEGRRIVDLSGSVVAEVGGVVPWPRIVRSSPVLDAGVPVARLEVTRSLRPILLRAFTMALLLVPFALLAFGLLRAIPLRAIHRGEEALRASEARFRALTEHSTDMTMVFDEGNHVQYWSPSATETLGWTAEEVMGRRIEDLGILHPEDAPAIVVASQTHRSGNRDVLTVVARHRHKNGSWRLIEGSGRNMLADPAIRGVVVNARDVTEERRIEEQFRQAQKLESIGRLAGGVAHDFNNLLTVILSCSEGIREAQAEGRPIDPEDVQQIREAGERARDFTGQLLAFARKQVISPVPLDLNDVLRNGERLLRRVLGEDIALEIHAQAGLWLVLCDPGQMEQLLLNLAANARDAMPHGGTLVIETRNARVDPGAADANPDTNPGATSGQWVNLVVRDSGSGMTTDVQERIFEPFFTTKELGKGTGLGLATVHGIVTQNGGRVLVESQPGLGTTFEVRFPRTLVDARSNAAPSPVPVPAPARGSETILVIEDDPRVRAVTVRALRAAGHRVLVAGNGAEALGIAEGNPGGLHLVVTDVVMPGMSGRAVVDALRSRRPGLPALFVSGYPQEVIARRGVLDTGIEFLAKPFTPSSLVARVRAILDAR